MGREAKDYLPSDVLLMIVNQPLELTGTTGKFDVIINVNGGGYSGQAGAIRHGISRALLEAGEDYRPVLKAAGFLTRDARVKDVKNTDLKQLVEHHSSQNDSIKLWSENISKNQIMQKTLYLRGFFSFLNCF